ncbi:Retinol dehydrogenase 12 [Mycena chlorophos]|uniref:Retinol dehydrogenase 12 n=1 Tax=Mycena chlorophos TaxID=658473 RepID=A0A8H6W7A0_MYCCL|nr:Retinol dehydrogenase 12 [Mycena chlorophos]
MKLPMSALIADQRRKYGPVLRVDLTGKTVILVGANTGLGFEACKYFASMKPARLIMACRSESKGNAALAKLAAETGYKTAELWLVDLASFKSVTAFADKWEADGGRLDILVLNAGLNHMKYEPAQDNWEASVFVNNVATPLLALRLLPSMNRTAERYSVRPRLVVVASDVHYWVSALDKRVVASKTGIIHTLADQKFLACSGGMSDRYFVTKLLNVFFVRSLADHLKSAKITAVAVNPGYCYSELRRSLPLHLRIADRLMEMALALPAAVGGQHIVWAALADDSIVKNGDYASVSEVREVSDYALSKDGVAAQARIWDELLDILKDADGSVAGIVQDNL